jgi:hypothetical protein
MSCSEIEGVSQSFNLPKALKSSMIKIIMDSISNRKNHQQAAVCAAEVALIHFPSSPWRALSQSFNIHVIHVAFFKLHHVPVIFYF